MARNLNLNKIKGLRADGVRIQKLPPLKPDTSFPQVNRSMKTIANVTKDGLKK